MFWNRYGQTAADLQLSPIVLIFENDQTELSFQFARSRITLVPHTSDALPEVKCMK